MIKVIEDANEVMNFAWKLSQNDDTASYHRIRKEEELQNKLTQGIQKANHQVIAYYSEDTLKGLCIYFWQDKEYYAQTVQLLIEDHYSEIADRMFAYIKQQLPGYELFVPIPFSNSTANAYLTQRGYACVDASCVMEQDNLIRQGIGNHPAIEVIDADNYQAFSDFHDHYAIPFEMYYNSQNILKELERFLILVYKEQDKIVASIATKAGKDISEVFCLFIDEEHKNKGIELLLINQTLDRLYEQFGSLDKFMYFIDEDSEHEMKAALASGCHLADHCRIYKTLL